MFSLILILFSSTICSANADTMDTVFDILKNDDVSALVSQLDHGLSPDFASTTDTLLTYSIKNNSIEMVSAILDHGANPDLTQPVSSFTPLMVAAKHNAVKAVELLLKKNANVNLTGVFGRNSLHVAALFNSIAVAQVLLLTDIDTNARGKLCPLAVASRQGYLDFVQLLVKESKVVPSSKCMSSAKEMASSNQNLDVLAFLNSLN